MPRERTSSSRTMWLEATRTRSVSSVPRRQRQSRSSTQCSWRETRIAIRLRSSGCDIRHRMSKDSATSSRKASSSSCPARSISGVENSIRMKKRPFSGSVECWSELVMLAPWRKRKLDTAATIPGRDQLGQGCADDRRRLESVGSPARADQESLDLRPPEDRAVVGRDVAEPGPAAQHPGALELGEELQGVPGGLLQEIERDLLAVRGPRLDLGSDQELAPVGLRDVDMKVGRDDDDV